MGEAVTPRSAGQLTHQSHGRRSVEHVEQIVFGCLGRPGQNTEVEVPTNNRSEQQHPLRALTEASDPGTNHLAHTVGQRHLLEGRFCDPSPAGVLVDRAGLGEMDEHFAHKERVAVGLAIQRVGKPHRGVVEAVTGSGLHECHDSRVVQPGEFDTRHAVLSAERSQGFEERMRARQLTIPIGPQHQHAHRLLGRDHVTQQLQARLVGPLQVIQYEDDRLMLRRHGQQSNDRGEEQVTLGVSIGRLRRPEPRQPARQRRDQPDQFRPVRVDVGDELVFGGVGDVMAERFGEELVRRGEILLAMPEQHARPGVEASAGRLGHQRGLAQTGLTRDEEHLASFAAGDALERIRHRRRLGFSTDDTRCGAHAQTARQRHGIRRGPAERFPAHLDGLHRIGQALQHQRPDRVAFVSATPTRHRSHHIRRQDLAALACRAQSSGLDHRIAEIVVLFPGDLTAAQPDP